MDPTHEQKIRALKKFGYSLVKGEWQWMVVDSKGRVVAAKDAKHAVVKCAYDLLVETAVNLSD